MLRRGFEARLGLDHAARALRMAVKPAGGAAGRTSGGAGLMQLSGEGARPLDPRRLHA
jgi:hypothetical protein